MCKRFQTVQSNSKQGVNKNTKSKNKLDSRFYDVI